MKTRLMAWAVLAGVCYVGYLGASWWSNPWAVSSVPSIGALLPAASAGCGEGCK